MDKDELIGKLAAYVFDLKHEQGISYMNFDRLMCLFEENHKIQKRIVGILEELKNQKSN